MSKDTINKVFGLGLSHTGTRSLNAALEVLGIPSYHWATDRRTYRELSHGVYDLTLLKRYQGLTDITAAPYYAQFDGVYPSSKFILTLRDKASWLRRMMQIYGAPEGNPLGRRKGKFWERLSAHVRRYGVGFLFSMHFVGYMKNEVGIEPRIDFQSIATYGGVCFADESRLSYVYDTHVKNVRDYFKDRPDDLLVMNIFEGDGWDRLCSFLGKERPGVDFPHERA